MTSEHAPPFPCCGGLAFHGPHCDREDRYVDFDTLEAAADLLGVKRWTMSSEHAPPFSIVYADPPWSYRGREQFGFAGDVGVSAGGAIKQYETMDLDALCALPVEQHVADDALLFLWATGPMLLADAPRVIRAWGFEPVTIAFVWHKQAANPGYYTLSSCEFVAVGKRGKIPQPRGTRNERQWVDGDPIVVSEKRGKRSKKPAEVRDRIARMFPEQSKIELFARERVDGWAGWGNEYPPC